VAEYKINLQKSLAVLISDKEDFKQKLVGKDKGLPHIDKGNNPSRAHNNCKHTCTEHQLT
jgi:hypothetical protein